MNFKKNKFIIIKKAVSKDLILFIYNYFLMKRQVAKTLFDKRYISPFESMFGIWSDSQVPNTYSHYADIVMETLLLKLQPLIEKETGLELNPNYSYARIYKKGDILERHKDRFSCEISTTLNLGGDPWPIYLDPTGKDNSSKGIKVNLKPGDMLVYRGNLLEHWREPFEGEDCAQVFLHYNNVATDGAEENMFDKRIHLGLPNDLKR
jgi:hypothetical protein